MTFEHLAERRIIEIVKHFVTVRGESKNEYYIDTSSDFLPIRKLTL